MKHTKYSFSKETDLPFEAALDKVAKELQNESFGILTEIDVTGTLKKKLDVDFKPYKILGACNPPLAYKTLQAEPELGLMLPCNVVVYLNDSGKTVVAAVDPVASMSAVQNPALAEIASAVQAKLKTVIERV